jgi:spore coat protein CotF
MKAASINAIKSSGNIGTKSSVNTGTKLAGNNQSKSAGKAAKIAAGKTNNSVVSSGKTPHNLASGKKSSFVSIQESTNSSKNWKNSSSPAKKALSFEKKAGSSSFGHKANNSQYKNPPAGSFGRSSNAIKTTPKSSSKEISAKPASGSSAPAAPSKSKQAQKSAKSSEPSHAGMNLGTMQKNSVSSPSKSAASIVASAASMSAGKKINDNIYAKPQNKAASGTNGYNNQIKAANGNNNQNKMTQPNQQTKPQNQFQNTGGKKMEAASDNVVLSDMDIISDVLSGQKALIKLYGTALCETDCPQLRSIISNQLTEAANDQFDAFLYMNQRGMYPTEQAQQPKVNKAKQKASQQQKQIKN